MTEILRTIGRYGLLRPIGIGGMAVVYLARQTDLDRLVAVKELRDFKDADSGLAERFIRESRLSGRLAHPNIVTVHDYCQHDGIPYIVMEYLRPGSLRPLMTSLTTPQVAGVLEGMLSAPAYAEAEGVIHRDLKPENVLVTDDGRVKIADFGIAKHVASQTTHFRTKTGQTIGTPTYMSPEQALADTDAIGPRSDLYAVGVMAYEMLLGRPPFEADNPVRVIWQHVNDPIPPPLEARPDLNPALAGWLEGMLEKSPDDRPAGADAAWRQLEDALADELDWRWRRQARLLPASSDPETPRPLTPAPFSEALPAWEASVALDAPPAVGAVPLDPEPSHREDSFATFVPDAQREAAPRPLEPVVPEPPHETESRGDPPAGDSVREPPSPQGRSTPADQISEAYETFGRRTGEPAPPPPPRPAQAAVVTPPPIEAPPPEKIEAPLIERTPVPESEVASTIAPTTRRREPKGDEPEPAAEPSRSLAFVFALVAVVVAAGALGLVVGPSSGQSGGKKDAAVTVAGLRASVPATWRQADDPPALPGLPLRSAKAFEPRDGSGAVVLGRADAASASSKLLPASLLAGSAEADPEPVDLGSAQAYLFTELEPAGRPARIYAVPTSRDVAIVGCLGAASGGGDCRSIAASVRVTDARALPVGPSLSHARSITRVMRGLGGDRAGLSAKRSTQQFSAAQELRTDFARASKAVKELNPGPADKGMTEDLAQALQATSGAYGGLAAGARARDKSGYRRAADAVERNEREVRQALDGFKAGSYGVER